MNSARSHWSVSSWASLLVGAVLLSACLERRDTSKDESALTRCATCHGDPSRSGDVLRRAAPPRALLGTTDVHNPGVGAHSIHLDPSKTHGAIACAQCHVVPERVDSPGHLDSSHPARVVFGALATEGDRAPAYDPVARTCGDTYCHRGADAVWSEPKTSDATCGSCHGLPPRLPHPQSSACSSCHGAVVDADRHFVSPALHVNGVVDFAPGKCTDCHGSDGNPAPPADLAGNVAVASVGVGAHRAHLAGGVSGRPLACAECHVVPIKVEEPTHADGLPAEVNLVGVAATSGRKPAWSHDSKSCTNTWCHGPDTDSGNTSPSWVVPGPLACPTCHGTPPKAPHPQLSTCSLCHGAVVGADDVTIVDRARHVDGVIDVSVPTSCTSCHGGSKDAAPVPGSPGAGAHRTHLDGTARSRKVECNACHVVPTTVLAPGHLDSPRPAEVIFSGVAQAGGVPPVYANSTCSLSPCHGAVFPGGDPSGGSNTAPIWTRVDGSQAPCGSCHAIPPPAPHPYVDLNPVCSACHKDIAPDNQTFTRPDLHVDGKVTFDVTP